MPAADTVKEKEKMTKGVTVKLTDSQFAWLEQKSASEDRTASSVIRRLINREISQNGESA